MADPDAKLIPITPHPAEADPLYRIGRRLQSLLDDTLTEPLPGDMLALLQQLDQVKFSRPAGPEPPRPFP